MQAPGLNQSATRAGTPRRARGLVLLGAGTLALVLAATSIAAALTGRFSPATQKHESSFAANSKEVAAGAQPSSSLRPVAPVLADGIYPTYIDQVDVRGAKMTLDLVQVFYDDAAATAAIEDGHSDADAVMGWYVYIRNQNSKLRTLPVARDLNIQFVDTDFFAGTGMPGAPPAPAPAAKPSLAK